MKFPFFHTAPAAGAEPTSGYRIGLISLLAAGIGILAGLIAFVLYDMIGLFTNLAFYHEFSFHFRSPEHSPLGLWIIVIPVVGGIIVGLMAKYGSDKIKGHGIPEAMEAVLQSRSRIQAKVAILKPLSAAIHLYRRPVRRGRSDHPDRRSIRLDHRTVIRDHRGRTKSVAGLRRRRGHGRHLQYADRRSDPGNRAPAI